MQEPVRVNVLNSRHHLTEKLHALLVLRVCECATASGLHHSFVAMDDPIVKRVFAQLHLDEQHQRQRPLVTSALHGGGGDLR